jgi:hypothetical protein
VSPAGVAIAITGEAPGVIICTVRTPASAQTVVGGFAPTVLQDNRISPASANVQFDASAPTVVKPDGHYIQLVSGDLSLSSLLPSVTSVIRGTAIGGMVYGSGQIRIVNVGAEKRIVYTASDGQSGYRAA